MTELTDIPADLPLFEGVPASKIPHVLKCLNATPVVYEKGARIFARDVDRMRTGYLCEGRAQLVSNDFWRTARSSGNTLRDRPSPPTASSRWISPLPTSSRAKLAPCYSSTLKSMPRQNRAAWFTPTAFAPTSPASPSR